MPLPGSRDRRYPFSCRTHHPQCLIDRVFTHWLIRVRSPGKISSLLPVISLICFRMRWTVLRGGRYAAFAFLPRGRITHANNGFSRRGYRPDSVCESISDQRAKRSSLERMNTCSSAERHAGSVHGPDDMPQYVQQFRQPLQRQGRIVPSDRRCVTPPRFAAGFVSINS